MKKSTFIVLVFCLLSSPCFAQQEIQGNFSIDNTMWQVQPPIQVRTMFGEYYYADRIGFCEGIIYGGITLVENWYVWSRFEVASHTDLFLICIFTITSAGIRYNGFLSSFLGFGFANSTGGAGLYSFRKISDNFEPN